MNDAYREQLDRLAEALAIAQNSRIADALAEGNTLEMVKLFTDGNLDKRFNKVQDQLEFVGEFFDPEPFEELIADYVRTVPLAAYDTGATDGERFLIWMMKRIELSEEQRDAVRCQRARHQVEDVARACRLQHIRFQERLSVAEALLPELRFQETLRVTVNPISVRSTFRTHALVDEDADLPALVNFFPVGSDIRTAVVEPDGLAVIEQLQARGPLTLAELQAATGFRHAQDELYDLVRDLVEMGLAAIV